MLKIMYICTLAFQCHTAHSTVNCKVGAYVEVRQKLARSWGLGYSQLRHFTAGSPRSTVAATTNSKRRQLRDSFQPSPLKATWGISLKTLSYWNGTEDISINETEVHLFMRWLQNSEEFRTGYIHSIFTQAWTGPWRLLWNLRNHIL